MNNCRIERDSLGEIEIAKDCYWGSQTQRAHQNFKISSKITDLSLIKALAVVKKACAMTNYELKFFTESESKAINQACDEVAAGKFDDQFTIDAMQGGAGTSTNMNVNEVIANRAIELLNGEKGDYSLINPLGHINLHQSTNDAYPTALKVAAIFAFRKLSEKIEKLQKSLQAKEKEFEDIATIGRTELQDAAPITLGSQFASFADALSRDRWRASKCEERLRVVNLGGTAVGTGITAPREYIFMVTDKLRELTGLGLSRSEQLMDATANYDPIVETAAVLAANATSIGKIAVDLRLMNYFKEINLPALQAGSSIMPGKVNPVIMEATIQVSMKVRANVAIIQECASRGTFQINEYAPLVADAFLESLELLANMNETLAKHVDGITANREECQRKFENNLMQITAFVPKVGYKECERVVKEYMKNPQPPFREYLAKAFGEEEAKTILKPENLTALGYKM